MVPFVYRLLSLHVRSAMFATLIVFVCIVPSAAISQVGQPISGPGGSDYIHAAVIKNSYGVGPQKFWIFEPSQPEPSIAPLIIFMHGWSGTNPAIYGAWIEHLVRKGNIVLYPVYQEEGSFRYPIDKVLTNSVSAVKEALRELKGASHVRVDLSKVAMVGHSMGGIIAANLCAVAQQNGIPSAKALMVVQPGKTWAKSGRVAATLEDLSSIPSQTLLLAVVGDADRIARDIDAKKIYYGATSVSVANKDFVVVRSDTYQGRSLTANHLSPAAPNADYRSPSPPSKSGPRGFFVERIGEKVKQRIAQRRSASEMPEAEEFEEAGSAKGVDALDYFGYWKLFDGLYSAAFSGKFRDYALGNTPQQRFMGYWDSNTPVRELLVTDKP